MTRHKWHAFVQILIAAVCLGTPYNACAQVPPSLDTLSVPPATPEPSESLLQVRWQADSDTPEFDLQRSLETYTAQPSNASSDSFQLGTFDGPSVPRPANDFTAAPEFKGGLTIFGENVASKIGGYVKADLIYDFDPIGSTDSFDTSTIPTSGAPHRNVRFHARQSRLSLDTRWRSDDDVARTFVEADFFGGSPESSSLRLRHAYGTFRRLTVGQTWTTFTDPSAVPQTLDVEGAVSNVNRRQGLVRWDQPLIPERLSIAFAIEDPQVRIESPVLVPGTGRTESPDFITRIRLENERGDFQGAFVLRELGFQPDDRPVITETAWGFNFSGAYLVFPDTKGYYQITFGEGIGSYRGSPDVVPTGLDSAAILPSFGWMVGIKHEWTERLTSNFTYSKLSLGDLPGQDPDNLSSTTYFAANLIANPYERIFCGVEYLYGLREDVSGALGAAHRLQMSFGFFLP